MDDRSFTNLYNQKYSMYVALLMKKVDEREIAEEIVQESFFKLWKYRHTIRGSAKAFLEKIVHNTLIDHYRRRKGDLSLDTLIDEEGFDENYR